MAGHRRRLLSPDLACVSGAWPAGLSDLYAFNDGSSGSSIAALQEPMAPSAKNLAPRQRTSADSLAQGSGGGDPCSAASRKTWSRSVNAPAASFAA